MLLFSSCVGHSVGYDDSEKPDSDSIEVIVNFVDTTTIQPDSVIAKLSPQQIDSLVFRLTHHYSYNFNFLVKADSLQLVPREGDLAHDTCNVYKNDLLVVASYTQTNDTVWVKVAHDQNTMGWIPEQQLLKGSVPDDQISEMLFILSDSRGIWMTSFVLLGLLTLLLRRNRVKRLHILQFSEMKSPYPQFFLVVVAIMASIYASVQNLAPEYWQEYYFHPSLNPFVLPPVMAALVVFLWLTIISFIAACDEVYHHFYAIPAILYILELTGLAMIVYLIISWTTLLYIGYLILPAFIYANIWIYHKIPSDKV